MLQWNQLVKAKHQNRQKENTVKMQNVANSSKMSRGTRKMICKEGGNCDYVSPKAGPVMDPVKAKLNQYLREKMVTESSRKEIRVLENVGNIVLPNCLFFQQLTATMTGTVGTTSPVKRTSRDLESGRKTQKATKGLLSENVVARSEKWIQQREQKIKALKQDQFEKSLDGCTFFPTFFTKTKQLF